MGKSSKNFMSEKMLKGFRSEATASTPIDTQILHHSLNQGYPRRQ